MTCETLTVSPKPFEVAVARVPPGCRLTTIREAPGQECTAGDVMPGKVPRWILVPGTGLGPAYDDYIVILFDPAEISAHGAPEDKQIWQQAERQLTGPGTGPAVLYVVHEPGGSPERPSGPAAVAIRRERQ